MRTQSTFLLMGRRSMIFLLALISSGILAQGVPEYMYFKFDATGNQQNYASAPVGTNPAVLNGLTIGGTGQFNTALQGNGVANNNLNTGWATSLPSTGWTISFWLIGNSDASGSAKYLFGDANYDELLKNIARMQMDNATAMGTSTDSARQTAEIASGSDNQTYFQRVIRAVLVLFIWFWHR